MAHRTTPRPWRCVCGDELLELPCFDGRRRNFHAVPIPGTVATRWVWRRGVGMVEADQQFVPTDATGLMLHYCLVREQARRAVRNAAGAVVT